MKAEFRQAMRRMAATVSIVAAEHEGQRCGLAATSVVSVCVDPPTVLVCINAGASAFPVVQAARRFSVNILGQDQRAIGDRFGRQHTQEERFAIGDWSCDEAGTPYLLNSQASLLCNVVQELPYATHSIFIAEVLQVLAGDCVDPLLYADGRYGSVCLEAAA